MRPTEANAITSATTGITSIVKLEVSVTKMLGQQPGTDTKAFFNIKGQEDET